MGRNHVSLGSPTWCENRLVFVINLSVKQMAYYGPIPKADYFISVALDRNTEGTS